MSYKIKKIAVFGLPGSGKSTFANKLGKIINLPVYHLDKYFFLANWEIRDSYEFLKIQQKIVDKDSWIIDGNSIATLEMRFCRADMVLYFKLPLYQCLWRIFKRSFIHDQSINDLAEGCFKKDIRWVLLKYLWSFHEDRKEKIENLRQKYPHVDFRIIKSLKDIKNIFTELTNS